MNGRESGSPISGSRPPGGEKKGSAWTGHSLSGTRVKAHLGVRDCSPEHSTKTECRVPGLHDWISNFPRALAPPLC